MQHATATAERVVAVLSAAYLESEHGEAEWQVFQAKDPLGKRGLLLPVRIGEVDPPGLLQTRIYVDLVALGASAASICARYNHVTPHPVHSDKPTSKPLTLQASQDGPAVGGYGTTDERRHRWRRRANWRRAPMRTVSAPSSIGAADHIPRPGMSRAPHMGADAQRRCRPSEAGKTSHTSMFASLSVGRGRANGARGGQLFISSRVGPRNDLGTVPV